MNDDFLKAVIRMDLDSVRAFLERDSSLANVPMNMVMGNALVLADVNDDADRIYHTFPLHYAVERNHGEMVRLLLRFDANVNNSREYFGWTPLHLAQSREVALLLLNHGANVQGRDSDGRTPLFRQLMVDDLDIAKLLIAHGADINATTNDSSNCIHYVNKLARMEFLLDQGANANAPTPDGKTPLHDLCSHRIARGDENESLATAAQLLIRHGAHVNARDNSGRTPLIIASAQQQVHHEKYLKYAMVLLNHGADIHASTKNPRAKTPFLLACRTGVLDLIYCMIRLCPHHQRPQPHGRCCKEKTGSIGLADSRPITQRQPRPRSNKYQTTENQKERKKRQATETTKTLKENKKRHTTQVARQLHTQNFTESNTNQQPY